MTSVFEALDASLPVDRTTRQFELRDVSHVGEVRRAVAASAERAALDATAAGRAAIIVNELCNNVLRHAGNGTALVRNLSEGKQSGVEIIVFDKGPGMRDVSRCMADGFSTIGTAGQGLGAIQRSSSVFDIHSQHDKGTIVVSQIWNEIPQTRFEVGAVCVPMKGEEVCGDAWITSEAPQAFRVAVFDGLGHGPIAAEASQRALQTLLVQRSGEIASILENVHNALRVTRGAAGAIAAITDESIAFSGVGNIAAVCSSTQRSQQHMISHNGTLGHQARKFQTFTYPWEPTGLMVMHSDGISTSWKLDDYPGIAMKHPAIAATLLYRDFNRGRDDATVVVVRMKP